MKLTQWLDNLPRGLAWGLVLPLLALNGWVFLLIVKFFKIPLGVLTTATLLSFILDYPVRWLLRRQVRRNLAVLWVVLGVLLLLGAVSSILLPVLIRQGHQLADKLPTWSQLGGQQIQSLHEGLVVWGWPIDLTGVADHFSSNLSNQLQVIANRIVTFIVGAAGGVFELLFTVVITLYLLLKGQPFWDGIFQWFPPHFRALVQQSLRRNFQNYFMGQATVAVLMAVAMTLAFAILQVPFSQLFGLCIGIMALFPLGGGLSICVVSFLVGLKSIWLGLKVLTVATILDQLIENGIAPRLLGDFVGVHPVWVLLSIMVGAQVLGVLGVLLAVPLAGCIKNLVDAYQPAKLAN